MDAGAFRLFHPVPGGLCLHSLEDSKKQGRSSSDEAHSCRPLPDGDDRACDSGAEPVSRENINDIAGYLENGIADFLEKYGEEEPEKLLEHRYECFRKM